MQRSLSYRWSDAVMRNWLWILIAWMVTAIVLAQAAPSWKQIAYDGDFEYLPASMPSVAGGRMLDEAFPGERSRSQIVLVLGRDSGEMLKTDDIVGLDLLRRLYHRLGQVCWKRAIDYGYEGGAVDTAMSWAPWIKLAKEALDQSIELDDRFYQRIADRVPDDEPTMTEPRMAIAYWDRGKLLELLGGSEEALGDDFEAALILMPELPRFAIPIADRSLAGWETLLDVLSWEDPVIGSRMQTGGARLAVLRLSSELAATGNIESVESVQTLIDDVTRYSNHYTDPGLRLLMTGSAAIGGETLLASRDAIRYTEWITVGMILLILAVVYRAPLLVAVPMISIGIAVVVSMKLVALLTQWSMAGTVPGLDLRVFTTSRIFIVVILFGAGTDYCLFLISRLREEGQKAPWTVACRNALAGVAGALTGSALTTVVGLGMLWIARFGKFHYTGPIIAICLLVGLLVCTTLTPALLLVIGPKAFWPARIEPDPAPTVSLLGNAASSQSTTMGGGLWNWIALMLTRRPITALMIGILVLIVPGIYGLQNEDNVTYDLNSQLSHSAQSRQGLRLLTSQFEIGEINPVTVLLVRPQDTLREDLEKEIKILSSKLYAIKGVSTVRTADDPLGDFPPNRDMGLLSSDAWRRRALRNHRIARQYFFSSDVNLENRLARLDVTIDGDPFSVETAALVSSLGKTLADETASPQSPWHDSQVLLAGTTPSIIDLRTVTVSDNRRIKIAVVVAVFLVLVVVIRRVGLCLYLIATVLLSYYATLGLTVLTFKRAYGDDFVGLDWKLPLFLFVILVAIGQDYNVYLVTRILEEQRRLGWRAALRRAVAKTGGIITACGLVMAATFFSMTASAWLPPLALWLGFRDVGGEVALRGIVELGFALGLGVLIDTFYVRTILVPSFVAITGQRAAKSAAD